MKYISIIALIVAGILTSTANAATYTRDFFEKQGFISKETPKSTVDAINKILAQHKVQDTDIESILQHSKPLISKKMSGKEIARIVQIMVIVRADNRAKVQEYASHIISDSMPPELVTAAVMAAHYGVTIRGESPDVGRNTGIIVYQESSNRLFIRQGDEVYAVTLEGQQALKKMKAVKRLRLLHRSDTKFEVSDKTLSGGKGEFKGNLKVAIPLPDPPR